MIGFITVYLVQSRTLIQLFCSHCNPNAEPGNGVGTPKNAYDALISFRNSTVCFAVGLSSPGNPRIVEATERIPAFCASLNALRTCSALWFPPLRIRASVSSLAD